MKVARKHFQKAAQKHMKGHQRHPSIDFSVQSSEDGRALYFGKDMDSISQDSRNGEMSFLVQGPAGKAAIHNWAMSEPVRRAHRVKIHEPPETRRGLYSRMSSTESQQVVVAPRVIADVFDLDSSSQASCPNSPGPDSQNPIPAELENEPKSPQTNCAEQQTEISLIQKSEPEQPEPSEELQIETEPDNETAPEPEQPVETDSVPEPQPVPQPEAKSFPLIAPSSPPRVRRTLEAPATPRPPTPIRKKARSRSCPRKPTTSPHTPMVNRRPAYQWQTQRAQSYGSYSKHVRPIPNGLCLSDSTSSSGGSTDSLEFVPSCVLAGAEQREGTLQREMKALFDQKMREIRCKSPLFPDEEL